MEVDERLLSILGLPPVQLQDARKVLTHFVSQLENAKGNSKTHVIEKVFPTVFGDSAAFCNSESYQSLWKSPW